MHGAMSSVMPQLIGGDVPYDRYAWFWKLQAQTRNWVRYAITNGGTITAYELAFADNLVVQMNALSYVSHIMAFYPFIGSVIATAMCPLIVRNRNIARGVAFNNGFTTAQIGNSVGLDNSGAGFSSSRIVNTGICIPDLDVSVSGNGGIGWYSRNNGLDASNVEPMGCYYWTSSTIRFSLDLRSSQQTFTW